MRSGTLRRGLVDAFRAALSAIDPELVVPRHLRRDGDRLEVAGQSIVWSGSVAVLALGKAAAGMARGVHRALGGLPSTGVVITDHDEPVPAGWRLMLGNHPFPGPDSLEAGSAALELAGGLGTGDLLVALVSGGGSALAEAPADGLDLEELVAVQQALMAAGAPIEELNRARRHLSTLKNGGLARAAAPARVVTLLISDVIDGPVSDVASGPTLADHSTGAEAAEVIRSRLGSVAPVRALRTLEERPAPLPIPDHPHAVVADIDTAVRAAAARLGELGSVVWRETSRLRGEASREAGRVLEAARPGFTVLGGETTVTGASSALGGRNQEAALSAAVAIDGRPGMFAALATDGIDGPTDAAGAIVDGGTVARGRSAGLDPAVQLRRHESHTFLEASSDLVRTGPTGTNVGDIWMIWRTED